MGYQGPNLTHSAVDHVYGDIQDHEQSRIGDPLMPVQQPSDIARRDAHERNS